MTKSVASKSRSPHSRNECCPAAFGAPDQSYGGITSRNLNCVHQHSESSDAQVTVVILRSQTLLVELADAGLGDLVD